MIDKSLLSYLRKILNHLDNVENNSKLRNIVSNFRPKMEDFYNELSYSNKAFLDNRFIKYEKLNQISYITLKVKGVTKSSTGLKLGKYFIILHKW